jgi:Rad3-related DNA helicase
MTGHDFVTPTDRGRWGSWQWIPKLPFADKSDPVVETRAEADEQIYSYDCGQTLVQACGRRQRSMDCRTVTLITDDAVKNFRHYSAIHMPKWFSVKDASGGNMPRRTA